MRKLTFICLSFVIAIAFQNCGRVQDPNQSIDSQTVVNSSIKIESAQSIKFGTLKDQIDFYEESDKSKGEFEFDLATRELKYSINNSQKSCRLDSDSEDQLVSALQKIKVCSNPSEYLCQRLVNPLFAIVSAEKSHVVKPQDCGSESYICDIDAEQDLVSVFNNIKANPPAECL